MSVKKLSGKAIFCVYGDKAARFKMRAFRTRTLAEARILEGKMMHPPLISAITAISAGVRLRILMEFCMSCYEKLKALNIAMPALASPAAAYVMYAHTGNLVFLSGHIAKKEGKPWVGQLGHDMTTEEGKEVVRAVAIDLLATLQAASCGDLKHGKRIVKVMSLVNSTSDFIGRQRGTDGAAE